MNNSSPLFSRPGTRASRPGTSSNRSISSCGELIRNTPSISEYYQASSGPSTPGKQRRAIVFLPGLKNYSSLNFGDDRISYMKPTVAVNEAPDPETNRLSIARTHDIVDMIESGDRRKKDYGEAWSSVGYKRLTECERLTRERIQVVIAQSHNDIKSVFAIFDRNHGNTLDTLEFARGIKLLGLNFNTVEIFALFGILDVHNSGHIESHDFFAKFGQASDDFDEEVVSDKYEQAELERAKMQRVKQLFKQFSKNGTIGTENVAALLERLKSFSTNQNNEEPVMNAISSRGNINFETFYNLWK